MKSELSDPWDREQLWGLELGFFCLWICKRGVSTLVSGQPRQALSLCVLAEETQRGREGGTVLIPVTGWVTFSSTDLILTRAGLQVKEGWEEAAWPPAQHGQQHGGILSLSGSCVWFAVGSKCKRGMISQLSQRFPNMSPNPTNGLGDKKEERDTRHTEVWI